MSTTGIVKGKIYKITSGPTKNALFDAFKTAYNPDAKVVINFDVLAEKAPDKTRLDSYIYFYVIDVKDLDYEDGSGYKFIVKGDCVATVFDGVSEEKAYSYLAYYDTKSHQGTIQLL